MGWGLRRSNQLGGRVGWWLRRPGGLEAGRRFWAGGCAGSWLAAAAGSGLGVAPVLGWRLPPVLGVGEEADKR